MPFALSRVILAANIAMLTKTTVKKRPITIIIIPVASAWYSRIGIPAPMKKAKDNEEDKPAKMLNQIVLLFSGWLTNSSINSELL